MQQEFRIMIRFFNIVFLNTKILGHGKSNQNLTQCVSSFYDRYYCLLEEVGRGLSKNCLFFSIQKKALNTLYCIILHVAVKKTIVLTFLFPILVKKGESLENS